MKRLTCFLLAVVMAVSLISVRTQASTGGKLVALTFDDGPHSTRTEQLLDGLKERGVHVTFFMQGYMAEDKLDIVRRVYDEGHEVANHTWNHPEMTSISDDSIKSQISRTNAVLDAACGKGTRYLVRPPYGSTNARVRAAIGAPLIHWSVDTNDWQYGYSHVYSHIVSHAYDGAIILCHDIHSGTIPAALDAIDVLSDRGYEFVTVSELYRRRGVEMENGVRYYELEPTGVDHGRVEAPVITYKDVYGGVCVTISSPSGAPVYYNTDGSRLNQESAVYSGSFVVTEPCTVKAVAAFNMNGGRSAEATAKISKMPSEAPEITYSNGRLKLTTATKGASIYYTTDGSTPTASSRLYTQTLSIEPGTVIRAVTGGNYFKLSSEVKCYYSEQGNFFVDVMPERWFADAVDEVASTGLMTGVGDYRFAPSEDVTRAMMVTILYRYNGENWGKGWTRTYTFTDVAAGSWYEAAVEWAYRNDIIEGYPGNLFKPNQSISRQEIAQIITRYYAFKGNVLPGGEDCRSRFRDGSQISGWALDSVNALVEAGLLRGDNEGNLNPRDPMNRASLCAILLRMIAMKEQDEATTEIKPIQKPPTELPIEPPTEPPIYILPTETIPIEYM